MNLTVVSIKYWHKLEHKSLVTLSTPNFSSQYRPWGKHKGHENKRNYHQLKKLLIVKQRNYEENSAENLHIDVRVWRF